jgi:tape measure domain-containing protein
MAFTVGQLEIQLIADVARLQKDMEKMQGTVRNATSRVNKSVESSVASFKTLIGVVGAAGLGRVLVKASDDFTRFNAILKQSTTNQKDFATATANVSTIARGGQADIASIGISYARFSNNLKEFGVTQEQVSDLTETLTLGLKVNGATSEETASSMIQLSQAFGKGKLDGDEFRTAMEGMPNVMRALAESMGVPFGALKDLAAEGQITSEVMLKAFTDPKLLAAYRKNAKDTETISGAWVNVKSRFMEFVGAVDKNMGAGSGLSKLFRGVEILLSVTQGGEKGSILRNFLDSNKAKEEAAYQSMGIADLKKAVSGIDNMGGDSSGVSRILDAKLKQAGSPNFSGTSKAYNGSPNFNALYDYDKKGNPIIKVDDVDKIHKKQEEERKLSQEKIDEAKKVYEAKKELAEQEAKEEAQRVKDQYDYNFKQFVEASEAKRKEEEKLQKESDKRVQETAKEFERLSKERERIVEREAEAMQREYERMADSLSRSLSDAIFRGFEDGKSFAENFLDSLKNMFKTTVLQPVVQLAVNASGLTGVMQSIGSALSGGGIAGQSGGNTIMGALGGIKDVIGSLNGSLLEGIQGLSGDLISNGFDKLGGFIFENSAAISNVLPFAGAAFNLLNGDVNGAIGSALGAALTFTPLGPIGGAIGAALGSAVGGLFGNKKPRAKIISSTARTSYEDGVATNNNAPYMYGKRFVELGAQDNLNALNLSFATTLGTLFKAYGLSDKLDIYSQVGQRKDTARGIFSGGGYSYDVGGNGNAQSAFNSMMEAVLGTGISTAVMKSELPENIKKFFDGLVDKDVVADTVNTLLSLKGALGDLPAVFDAVRNAIDTTSYTVSIDALKAQFAGTQQFVELFYTSTEKIDIFAKQLTTQFAALNLALPTSRDEFRKLVESFAVTDQATFDQRLALVSLSGAMDQYYNSLGDQLQVINQINAALGMDRFSKFSDFVIANAYSRKGLDIPAANMPSYAVGTSYVPSDGMAMLHQGEAVLTRYDNATLGRNTGQMVSLLNTVVTELNSLKAEVKRGADSAADSASDLDDIATGNVTIRTRAA